MATGTSFPLAISPSEARVAPGTTQQFTASGPAVWRVNGILGGYTGAGSKTVLPSEASAKLTFRLVAGQNPNRIVKAFRTFVKSQLPADCKARFVSHGGSGAADSGRARHD